MVFGKEKEKLEKIEKCLECEKEIRIGYNRGTKE
jgi:hypothetical protein